METHTENTQDLAIKWKALASANRLLMSAVKNNHFDIVPSRKIAAIRAYRAFWDSPGADAFANANINFVR
jgi:hypothetical protein